MSRREECELQQLKRRGKGDAKLFAHPGTQRFEFSTRKQSKRVRQTLSTFLSAGLCSSYCKAIALRDAAPSSLKQKRQLWFRPWDVKHLIEDPVKKRPDSVRSERIIAVGRLLAYSFSYRKQTTEALGGNRSDGWRRRAPIATRKFPPNPDAPPPRRQKWAARFCRKGEPEGLFQTG